MGGIFGVASKSRTFSSELIIIPIWEHAEAVWQYMIRNVASTV